MEITMWYGLATQSMKDFGNRVANETRNDSNNERIANHVAEAALQRAKLAAIKLNDRGTEMVPGFGLKRDYRRSF